MSISVSHYGMVKFSSDKHFLHNFHIRLHGNSFLIIIFFIFFFSGYSRHNSSQDGSTSDEGLDKLDVHHQYFTVAVDFLKDILTEASVVLYF